MSAGARAPLPSAARPRRALAIFSSPPSRSLIRLDLATRLHVHSEVEEKEEKKSAARSTCCSYARAGHVSIAGVACRSGPLTSAGPPPSGGRRLSRDRRDESATCEARREKENPRARRLPLLPAGDRSPLSTARG